MDSFFSTLSFGQLLVEGLKTTVSLTICGAMLALVIAFVFAFVKLSRWAALRLLGHVYVEFFRGTSVIVQLFWIYFVLPLFGVPISPFMAGVIALGMMGGAYGAETVRGAIIAVPKEQHEACLALNLTKWQSFRHVILPQALVIMLPTFGNNIIELLKGTAVVSLISISDLTFQAQIIRAQTGETAGPFITILSIYYALSLLFGQGMKRLERHFSKGSAGTRGARA